ncbi:MAG: acylphosphatase [Rhodospirillales bacterium CG15_BIG_FIL_POST_REV_8_21_14_020_66_15]|nr:MAG: acylphosphatase [Rhodospirillales bacterium CG15_BIG_FIL_POST_REV_8_21_14_020_66_15]
MRDAGTAVHVTISGRVQGVWFRGWTCEQARELGLTGWVRNRRDGTVEAVFRGDAVAVRQMVERCQEGPPAARVTDVRTQPAADPGLPGFEPWPTV